MENKVPSLIKWAGGKKQLLSQFEKHFPDKVERYFEPFVGGGAVAWHIIKKYNPREVYLSDINEKLINVYLQIKNNVGLLIKELEKFRKLHNKENYYKIREQNPESLTSLTSAARFIYLNKTCFNGLYRVNSKGKFNVPLGSYKNPSIYSEIELREISQLLKNVHIEVKQFSDIKHEVKEADFIYFDPPYYPIKKTSFTKYARGDFLEKEQIKLKELFEELVKRGAKVMLSNSDSKFIKNLYKDYNVAFVQANRMINCDATKRGAIREVVITNY